MLQGFHDGSLEVRRSADGSHRLRGRFPYGKTATLSSGGKRGRPKKEKFAPRAFAYRVEKPDEDIHLLVGHDYGQPLASKATQTLSFTDTDEALTFDAIITPQIADTSYGADILKLILSGLAVGLSPGFLIPPERAVPNAEKVEDEGMDPANGAYNAIIRTILAALLYEISIVTRPAYDEATVEARNWQVTESGLAVPKQHASIRWR